MRKIDFFYDEEINAWRRTGTNTIFMDAERAAHDALIANQRQYSYYMSINDVVSASISKNNMDKLERKMKNTIDAIERSKAITVDYSDFYSSGTGYITSSELPTSTPKGTSYPAGSGGTNRGKGYFSVFHNDWDEPRTLYSIYIEAQEDDLVMEFFKDIASSSSDDRIKNTVTDLLMALGV